MGSNLFDTDFSGWILQHGDATGYAALGVVNYAQLLQAYGEAHFRAALEEVLADRLSSYGISHDDMLVWGYCILIRLSDKTVVQMTGDDLFSEKLCEVLSYVPVQVNGQQFILHLNVVWLGAADVVASGLERIFSEQKAVAGAVAYAEAEHFTPEQIRYDMQTACQFFRQLHNGNVNLSFRSVQLIRDDKGDHMHCEALLRHVNLVNGEHRPCGNVIAALERLHLIERLDTSVLWTIVHVLHQHPWVSIRSNLSSLSLRRGGCWTSVIARLHREPDLARRLTIGITEAAGIMDVDEAFAMLQSLRGLGCRIALDDVRAGPSTKELAKRLRLNVVKLDEFARDPAGQESVATQGRAPLEHASLHVDALSNHDNFAESLIPPVRPIIQPAFVDGCFKFDEEISAEFSSTNIPGISVRH